MNKLLLIIVVVLIHNSKSSAQNNLFDFKMPPSLHLIDSMSNENSTTYSYKDTNGRDHLHRTVYNNRMSELNYFKVSTNETVHAEYNETGILVSYGYKKGSILSGYHFYSGGQIAQFQIIIEDTTAQKFRLLPTSFFMEFHPNGQLKTHYCFLEEKQEYKEYWSNGNLKIVADFLSEGRIYCGNYREYDEAGQLIIKGQFSHNGNPLDESKRCGKWKFYQNGKLLRKERYNENGNLRN